MHTSELKSRGCSFVGQDGLGRPFGAIKMGRHLITLIINYEGLTPSGVSEKICESPVAWKMR